MSSTDVVVDGAQSSHQRSDGAAVLGPEDIIGEGDTFLTLDILPPQLAEFAFQNLTKEVSWHTMYHRGTYLI